MQDDKQEEIDFCTLYCSISRRTTSEEFLPNYLTVSQISALLPREKLACCTDAGIRDPKVSAQCSSSLID